jgi:hypothetical protein
MKGDFTRSTFKKEKHYNSVRMQQGRVQLDADWNEQMDIQAHLRQTEAVDVIGRTGAPKYGGGFNIDALPGGIDLTISPGRIYVDGILCELEAAPQEAALFQSGTDIQVRVSLGMVDGQEFKERDVIEIVEGGSDPWFAVITDVDPVSLTFTIEPVTPGISVGSPETEVRLRRCTTYFTQPHYPNPDPGAIDSGVNLVYLDVWQRHVTALEDEYIREKALGGPDTATRTQTLWQVKLEKVGELGDVVRCSQLGENWKPDVPATTGQLTARSQPGEEPDDPCILPPNAGYRRLENQLYRVEIHNGGSESSPNKATFKWSRDNGTVVARVDGISGEEITVSHVVQGRLEEFAAGQWVEVTDDAHELLGKPGTLVKIKEVKAEKIKVDLTTKIGALEASEFPLDQTTKIRRWDSNGLVEVNIPARNNGFLKLEKGVEVKFEEGYYNTGDYWLIPARTATNDVEWPGKGPKAPQGIHHHYCKLALVNVSDGFEVPVQDCRPSFPPLNEVKIGKGCCTYTVGDGRTSFGDYDSIREAVAKVLQGGRICLLPGIHQANVEIINGKNITITGCGHLAQVIPEGPNRDQPVFTIEDSQFITLENMDIVTFSGTAVLVQQTQGELKDIEISENRIFALKHAVRVVEGEKIKITGNHIRMYDREEGGAAIFMLARDSTAAGNDISVVQVPEFVQLGGEMESLYRESSQLAAAMNRVWEHDLSQYPADGFNAPGGIQIAGNCEGIKILDNRIYGGYWNGITLGHTPPEMDDQLKPLITAQYGLDGARLEEAGLLEELAAGFDGFIKDLAIENNEISYMGLNGIGVVNFFSLETVGLLVSVNNAAIYRNKIVKCLGDSSAAVNPEMVNEMALGGIALADCEDLTVRENLIEENGPGLLSPACGVFVQYGEKIDISDNRVLNNGPETLKRVTGAVKAIGGGIVIRWTLKTMLTNFMIEKQMPYTDGVPAVKIHDNIVTHPMGPALVICAMGPVSVVGNHLTSQGIDAHVLFYWLAGAVLIIDLGVSRDLFAAILLAGLRTIMQGQTNRTLYMGQAQMFTAGNIYMRDPCFLFPLQDAGGYTTGFQDTQPEIVGVGKTDKFPLFEFLLYLPGGSVLFSNNQTTLDLRSGEWDFALCSQLIFSLDDIAYVSNQSECNSFLDAVIADVVTLGVTVRNNDNRFQEGFTLTLFSLISIGLWLNTWTGNQASHCITAVGLKDETYGNNMVMFGSLLTLIKKDLSCDGIREWLSNFLNPRAKIVLQSNDTFIEQ